MAAGQKTTIQMTGGGPWGFRLYGGDSDPLVVAKLRKRSKAHDAGLQEGDVLLAINFHDCRKLNHPTAMGLIDASGLDLRLDILRGTSNQNAIDAAFQELGSQLRPVPASAIVSGLSPAPSSSPRHSPRHSPAHPEDHSQNAQPPTHAQQQQHLFQPQYNVTKAPSPFQPVLNGDVSRVPFSHTERHTVKMGDTTQHITTETQQENMGGTTITKTRREVVSETTYGGGPGAGFDQHHAPQPSSMFQVSNVVNKVPKDTQPGLWTPSGAGSQGVRQMAPQPEVKVRQAPDQSVTMTIGMHTPQGHAAEVKENIAPASPQPQTNMFNVNKFGQSPQPPSKWQPLNVATAPPKRRPSPLQLDQSQVDATTPNQDQHEHYDPDHGLNKPLPLHLQKILTEGPGSGSDMEGSGLDSPGYLSRRKKKVFADSAFYDDCEHKYPTIEEQIKMAKKVALSLTAPANKKARGHCMFVKRQQKAVKWTIDEPGVETAVLQTYHDYPDSDEDEKYYNPDPWKSAGHTWQPSAVPLAPAAKSWDPPPAPPIPAHLFKAATLPNLKDNDKSKALSAEEFERMRLYEQKSEHTNISPQVCFNLAEDLRSMKGKGGKLFAKRAAKAEKWVVDEDNAASSPNTELMQRLIGQAPAGATEPLAPQLTTTNASGEPHNRLKDMIDPPKAAMTPWDACANYGNIDKAFEHLHQYHPYGRSHKGQIVDTLELATQKHQGQPTQPPPPSANPSGPVKLPEFTRTMKPWGSGSDSASAASGPSSASSSQAGAASSFVPQSSGQFRPVKFKAGADQPGTMGVGPTMLQPGAAAGFYVPAGVSPVASGGGGGSGGYCDL